MYYQLLTSLVSPVPDISVLEVRQVGAEVAELLLQAVRGVGGAFQNVTEQFPEAQFVILLVVVVRGRGN